MSEEANVIQKYIQKSPDNFRLASAIANEMRTLRTKLRLQIWEKVAEKCEEEFKEHGFQVLRHFSGKNPQKMSIFKPTWIDAKLGIEICAEAEWSDFRYWFFGLKKLSDTNPYEGKQIPSGSIISYSAIRDAALGDKSKSSAWWLIWQYYPKDFMEMNDEQLATCYTDLGFHNYVEALFQPLKQLKENVEPIIESELQKLK